MATQLSRLDLHLLADRHPGWLLMVALLLLGTFFFLRQSAPVAVQPLQDTHQLQIAEQQFRASLLSSADLANAQQAIVDLAQQHALSLGRIDYTPEAEPQGGFTRVGMRLPLSGRYADLRSFIDESLRQQPALALRQLTMEQGSNYTVQATLTVEFLLGEVTK